MTRRSSVIEFRPWKYSVTGLEDYSEQTLTRAEFVLNVVGTAKCASACAELNKIVALAATHSGGASVFLYLQGRTGEFVRNNSKEKIEIGELEP